VNREINVSDRLKHISEIALDDYKFDYVIDNTSDMDHLISEVTIFLKQFNII
jgi:hypothetical protein